MSSMCGNSKTPVTKTSETGAVSTGSATPGHTFVPRLQGIGAILFRRQAWGLFRTHLRRISAHLSRS